MAYQFETVKLDKGMYSEAGQQAAQVQSRVVQELRRYFDGKQLGKPVLLARAPAAQSAGQMGRALAALLRIGTDSFSLQTINDTVAGCGLPALVEEAGRPLAVRVSFPSFAGIPADFSEMKQLIEEILPCHLEIEYRFWYLTWAGLEEDFATWISLEKHFTNWETLEKQVL